MAASRDCSSDPASLGKHGPRPGIDDVHDDMLDARLGVRKGCDDWWLETEAIDVEQEVDEACEEDGLVDREDMLIRMKGGHSRRHIVIFNNLSRYGWVYIRNLSSPLRHIHRLDLNSATQRARASVSNICTALRA
jgi:hypothetical protein